MTPVDEKTPALADLTTPQPESDDPAYRAWTARKIEAALTEDRANPERRLAERAVWRKHGLER